MVLNENLFIYFQHFKALGEEGIFRIPGSATDIKELKIRYDKGNLKMELNNFLLFF